MLTYLLRRLALGAVALIGVSIGAFVLVHLVPGDPVRAMLPPTARLAQVELLREQYGLSESLPSQYWMFVSGALQLDFGDSIFKNEPVTAVIASRLGRTVQLVGYALLLSIVATIPLGTIAAVRRNRASDHGVRFLSTLGLAMPPFWFGLLLILIFGVNLGWFPTSGLQDGVVGRIESLTLPALTLAVGVAPLLVRTLRISMIDTLDSDYIVAARARGLPRRRIVFKHALRASLTATLTVLGIFVGALLGGAVVVENVFDLGGIGTLLIDSVGARDFPVIQALVILFGAWVILVNLVTDLAYAAIDPRVRHA